MDTFVSRGGIKLQAALKQFTVDVKYKIVLDVGSSTGGFVDCLLQNGARKVYALDTSYGELAWKLRNDPRVMVMERTNILYLDKLPSTVIPAKAGIYKNEQSSFASQNKRWILNQVQDDDSKVDLITIDCGWTRLELILPKIQKFLKPNGQIIALLKPQYETDKKNLVKGVVSEELVESIKNDVIERVRGLGCRVSDQMESPILGGGGNQEYLLLLV